MLQSFAGKMGPFPAPLFASTAKADAYRAMILADNPVAYWRLAERSGIVATDEMNAFAGTYMPNAAGSWTGGQLNNLRIFPSQSAPNFNGTTGYAGVNSSPLSGAQLSNFTFEFWVRGQNAASQASRAMLALGSSLENQSIVQITSWDAGMTAQAGKVQLLFRRTNGTVLVNAHSNAIVFDDNWHHVALAVQGSIYRLYMDGVADITGSWAGGDMTMALNRTGIGATLRATPVNFWRNYEAEVAIYNTVLSPAKIAAHAGGRN